ncbi:IS1595 family transposase [Candidatus Saccharibacteria bacterium]|nr:IS1595 family transposase [Candidatus Saccharibacteria bacterium]
MRYTLKDMQTQFPNGDVCLQFIFDKRYGKLKTCPKCGVEGTKFYRVRNRMSFVCKECRHQIYPLVDTIFEKSTTPLTDWFHAIYLFSVSKNGVSAKELERHVGVSYKTAHRMYKQIRLLMKEYDKLGFLGTPVEVDEVFIGGRRKQSEVRDSKTPVIAALEVGGHVRTEVVAKAVSKHAVPFLEAYVRVGSMLHTDESKIYKTAKVKAFYDHASVRHIAMEFAKDGVTTNHVEGFFGQFRRSLDGTYHAVSPRYLASYAAEFAYRYNHRHELVFPLLLKAAAKRV